MLTNPNTLGLFDENIAEIASIVHGVGGTLYYDGANLNAIMGYTRPGDMGFRRARQPRPWRGDLTAELIGHNLVPLTGAGLKADLQRFPTTGDADTIATQALMRFGRWNQR